MCGHLQVLLSSLKTYCPCSADITFMVEGRPFHAHRIALLASSEAFRAMFNQGFREKDATCISIPNLSWAVFEVG